MFVKSKKAFDYGTTNFVKFYTEKIVIVVIRGINVSTGKSNLEAYQHLNLHNNGNNFAHVH